MYLMKCRGTGLGIQGQKPTSLTAARWSYLYSPGGEYIIIFFMNNMNLQFIHGAISEAQEQAVQFAELT